MTGLGMLTCLRVTRKLQRYLDGQLDDAAARRVTRHLARCRRCRTEANVYAAIKTSLRGLSRR